jgi:conjugative transfer pilus assembly protein TraH
MIKNILFTITFFIFSNGSYASINSDLNNYFNDLGFSSNVSKPSAYQGQSAGYYSGGSVFTRSAIRDVQVVQLDLPSYRSGCGGIDLYAGGLSFIKDDQLVQMLQSILNNAAGYSFTLALETVTPEIANVMKYMEDVANFVNQANVNSCETAEDIVGGMWPKNRAAQQRICEDVGAGTGFFSDWAQARQKCGLGGEFNNVMSKGKQNPYYKNMIIDTGNIVWKATQQIGFLKSDRELSEVFMSLSGTVVMFRNGSGDSAPLDHVQYPALVENNDLMKAILYGGPAKVYRCDTTDPDGCLHPAKDVVINISASNAFSAKVTSILNKIVDAIYDDTSLTDEEIGLLQSTSLPVYKMLNVQVASQKYKPIIDVTNYADVIAIDILYQYLRESLQIIKNSVASLPYPDGIINDIAPGIDAELADLRKQQGSAYKQLTESVQIIEETQTLERMLAGDLSTELSNTLSWAKGMHS